MSTISTNFDTCIITKFVATNGTRTKRSRIRGNLFLSVTKMKTELGLSTMVLYPDIKVILKYFWST